MNSAHLYSIPKQLTRIRFTIRGQVLEAALGLTTIIKEYLHAQVLQIRGSITN